MFVKGNCAIYIDKNLKLYENSTGIFVLWLRQGVKVLWKFKFQNYYDDANHKCK